MTFLGAYSCCSVESAFLLRGLVWVHTGFDTMSAKQSFLQQRGTALKATLVLDNTSLPITTETNQGAPKYARHMYCIILD